MLSEQELMQICRRYPISCPICGTDNEFFRLKRDICRPVKTEGDGHPLNYRWGKAGFDSVDPLQFHFGVCKRCRFTGELADADFRQSDKMAEDYRGQFNSEGLRQLLMASNTGKGITQSLGKRIRDDDPMGSVLAQFHLGIFCQSLNLKVVHNNIARYFLRIGWIYRDQETFYPTTNLEELRGRFERLKKRWAKELPKNREFPVPPEIALDEVEALRLSRAFFERNYEMLREARIEDELRLRHLLAEIGYRIYELSSEEDDFQKASTFFSGAMQQCLGIISDKSIVGGVVNRAKEMLEICGDRGRELRELHKKSGGAETGAVKEKKKGVKKKVKKKVPAPKVAQPDKAETKAEVDRNPELDQANRQVSVLSEELTDLKDRVKTLEDDNKKWRQLAGRDTVTGLPNKTMLFRLVLPKVLQNVGKVGPFSCIAVSFDQVAQVNQGHGWLVGDRMLKESVKCLRQFVQEGEELYRLEGVHFALVGPMSSNVARQRATDMRRRLSKASVQVDSTRLPLVSSLGVVTVEQVAGSSPAQVANGIFEALLGSLYKAKEKGGNAVEVFNQNRF